MTTKLSRKENKVSNEAIASVLGENSKKNQPSLMSKRPQSLAQRLDQKCQIRLKSGKLCSSWATWDGRVCIRHAMNSRVGISDGSVVY